MVDVSQYFQVAFGHRKLASFPLDFRISNPRDHTGLSQIIANMVERTLKRKTLTLVRTTGLDESVTYVCQRSFLDVHAGPWIVIR